MFSFFTALGRFGAGLAAAIAGFIHKNVLCGVFVQSAGWQLWPK